MTPKQQRFMYAHDNPIGRVLLNRAVCRAVYRYEHKIYSFGDLMTAGRMAKGRKSWNLWIDKRNAIQLSLTDLLTEQEFYRYSDNQRQVSG